MKSYCFALAALAAIGLSGAAFAGEATKGPSPSSPIVKGPVAMTDAEMDKVTGGATHRIEHGPFTDKDVGQGICGPVRACP